jgi:hypothetical protein
MIAQTTNIGSLDEKNTNLYLHAQHVQHAQHALSSDKITVSQNAVFERLDVFNQALTRLVEVDDFEGAKMLITALKSEKAGYVDMFEKLMDDIGQKRSKGEKTIVRVLMQKFVKGEIANDRLMQWLQLLEPDCFHVGYPIDDDNPIVMYLNFVVMQHKEDDISQIVKDTLNLLTTENTTSFRDLLELLVVTANAIDPVEDEALLIHPLYKYMCRILVNRNVIPTVTL